MGNSIKIENCVFCNIIMQDPKREIIYEDDKMILVNDNRPGSKIHILAISKRHIKNINYLSKEDIPLLKLLGENAKNYIEKNFGKENLSNLRYW